MPAKSIGSPNGAGRFCSIGEEFLNRRAGHYSGAKLGPGIRVELKEAGWGREQAGGQVLRLGAVNSCRGQKAAELLNEACTVRERCLQLGRGVMGSQREPSSPQNNSLLLRERLG